MHRRCSNPNDPSYDRYGARGIEVCARWKGENGFANFLADMGERPEGSRKYEWSIDRIDSDRDYEPGNCRWATWDVQNRHHIGRPKTSRRACQAERLQQRQGDQRRT